MRYFFYPVVILIAESGEKKNFDVGLFNNKSTCTVYTRLDFSVNIIKSYLARHWISQLVIWIQWAYFYSMFNSIFTVVAIVNAACKYSRWTTFASFYKPFLSCHVGWTFYLFIKIWQEHVEWLQEFPCLIYLIMKINLWVWFFFHKVVFW